MLLKMQLQEMNLNPYTQFLEFMIIIIVIIIFALIFYIICKPDNSETETQTIKLVNEFNKHVAMKDNDKQWLISNINILINKSKSNILNIKNDQEI